MDWNNLTSLAEGQGTVFWVATVAVSLGLTMLVTALVQALRQATRRRATSAAPTPPPAEVRPAREAVQAYAASDPPPPAAAPEDSSVALLLRRLQQAGDRLEEIAGDLDASAAFDAVSGLKSEPLDVEYVFRASGS
jgi:hypothetical protein